MATELAVKAPAEPRRQHYVPRFYLARFADQKGRLAAYDRRTSRTILTTPRDAAVEKDFYRLPSGLRATPTALEDVFAYEEDLAAPAMRRVATLGVIDADDRAALSLHIALQMLRTPRIRKELGALAEWGLGVHAQKDLRGRLESNTELTPIEMEQIEEALHDLADGTLSCVPKKSRSPEWLLEHLKHLGRCLSESFIGCWLFSVDQASFRQITQSRCWANRMSPARRPTSGHSTHSKSGTRSIRDMLSC